MLSIEHLAHSCGLTERKPAVFVSLYRVDQDYGDGGEVTSVCRLIRRSQAVPPLEASRVLKLFEIEISRLRAISQVDCRAAYQEQTGGEVLNLPEGARRLGWADGHEYFVMIEGSPGEYASPGQGGL